MKLLVPAAVATAAALTVLPATPAAADSNSTPPTVTQVALGLRNVIWSPTSPCAQIPITIAYNTNGDYVYQVDVYITHDGQQPPASVAPSAQLKQTAPSTGNYVTGSMQYCPSTMGVGILDAGPLVFHYGAPSDVGQSTAPDPHVALFDVQQASVATLHAKRHHKHVILKAAEAYYYYKNSALTLTTSQKAIFQRMNAKKHWKTIGKAKPKASTGYAQLKVKAPKTKHRNYRVIFKDSTTVATAVSDVVTK